MSDWRLVIPETTQNKTLNSSAETTGNFANVVGGAATRVTTAQKYGLYSYRLVTAANNDGMTLTLSALANAIHHVTMRVNDATLASTWDWSLDNATYTSPTLVEAIDGTWSLYELAFPAAQANASTLLYIRQDGAGALDINIDGVQVEEKDGYYTTFCDGDQKGCESLGAEHASVSQRSAQSRAGGRLRDLKDFYGFGVANFMNTGMPTQSTEIDNYALVQGGQLNDIKVEPREFTLMGTLSPAKIVDCTKSLDDVRADLEEELAHDRYPEGLDGWQPILIRYTGDDVQKEIAAHYSGGLEGRIAVNNQIQENVPLRFSAPDPNWYEIGQSAAVLDTNDAVAAGFVKARLDDQWTNVGTFNGQILALAEDDQYVYIGGAFPTQAADANQSFITRYNKETGVFAAMGTGLNNTVYDIAVGSDGLVYITGQFTAAGGDVQADYFCTWNGTVFNNLGDPDSAGGPITFGLAVTIALNGDIYVGGLFTNWAGTGANHLVYWDLSAGAWTAMPSNPSTQVSALITAPDSTIYIGGLFLNYGGADGDYVSSFDGTTVTPLAAGLNGAVEVFEVTDAGLLYIGGQFTNVVDATGDYIITWNGTTYGSLATPPNASVWALELGYDDLLYVGGQFTEAGGLTRANRFALWTGTNWAHWDIDLSGASNIRAIMRSRPDPVVLRNYDLWVGQVNAPAANAAGLTTVTNEGTAHTFPEFIVERSGGTEAIVQSLRNETRGSILLYDYSLLDGEKLTTFNHPLVQDIVSSLFGQRLDATLTGDDFGDWSLQPNSNRVTCFVDVTGATIVGYLQFRTAYKGHAD